MAHPILRKGRHPMTRLSFDPTPLTLGAVQLGMAYGVANETGQPSRQEAAGILDAASAAGIGVIDTARAYGESEARIGAWLASRGADVKVVTKIPAVPDAAPGERARYVAESLAASSEALGRRPLDLVLAHRAADLLDTGVRTALEEARATGLIAGFGASVYGPEAARQVIETVPIQALQAPVSLVDRRMQMSGMLDRAREAGVAVFARSAFLQGALLMAPARLPAHLSDLTPARAALDGLAGELGLTLHALALAGVRDLQGITSVVVGVERADQIAPHVEAMATPRLPDDVLEEIARIADGLPEALIDPSRWPRVERP